MTTPPITELTTRARDVFRLVVDAYLETGQPVGSRTLSKLAALNLSPASIRNVMQDLEEYGLLASPHTSAGRLPTEQGLRLFVDGMMQVAEPSAEDRAQIEASLSDAGPIESALAQATSALSGLSACAGLVLVPKHERVLKQLAFVPLSANQSLAFLGMAAAGAGLAPVAPILFNAATRVPGVSRAAAIASVTAIGYSGFLVGPPIVPRLVLEILAEDDRPQVGLRVEGGPWARATTDAEGRVTADGVATGTYVVRVKRPGQRADVYTLEVGGEAGAARPDTDTSTSSGSTQIVRIRVPGAAKR